MNHPIPVSLDEIVRRARSVLRIGKYGLGKGGRIPAAATPFDADGFCDCSGFVSWCLGIDRYQPGKIAGDYVETTAMVRDAFHEHGLFLSMEDRQSGYVIVYGDHDGGEGHTGIITAVNGGRILSVVHCSSGNYHGTGHAIAETDPSVFLRHAAVAVKFRGVTG